MLRNTHVTRTLCALLLLLSGQLLLGVSQFSSLNFHSDPSLDLQSADSFGKWLELAARYPGEILPAIPFGILDSIYGVIALVCMLLPVFIVAISRTRRGLQYFTLAALALLILADLHCLLNFRSENSANEILCAYLHCLAGLVSGGLAVVLAACRALSGRPNSTGTGTEE